MRGRESAGAIVVATAREMKEEPEDDACSEDDAFEEEVLRELAAQARAVKREREADVEGDAEEIERGGRPQKSARVDSEVDPSMTCAVAGAFSRLPEDVVSLILRRLAPNELVSLAMTCKFFSKRCDQDFLWRQCFIERFGNTKQARQTNVKRLYFAADMREIDRETRQAPKGFEKICGEAFAAKRSQVCANLAPMSGGTPMYLAAVEWKGRRKFVAEEGHLCSRRAGCSYHELPGKVFVCEKTGNIHVCDETCAHRYLDSDLGTEICEISGASFDVLQDEEEDDEAIAEQDQHYFEKGYFGRAFEVGYGCDNENELPWSS